MAEAWLGLDWAAIEAIGTWLAFAAAGFGAVLLFRDHRRAEDDRRRAQASKVWVYPTEGYETDERPGELLYTSATVMNGSDQPIYDVYVVILTRSAGRVVATHSLNHVDYLLPGVKDWWDLRQLPDQEKLWSGSDLSVLTVHFRDTLDRHWRRTARGALTDAADAPV